MNKYVIASIIVIVLFVFMVMISQENYTVIESNVIKPLAEERVGNFYPNKRARTLYPPTKPREYTSLGPGYTVAGYPPMGKAMKYKNKSKEEMMKICDSMPGCIGFTTYPSFDGSVKNMLVSDINKKTRANPAFYTNVVKGEALMMAQPSYYQKSVNSDFRF